MSDILYERDGDVAVIRLNRPDELNAVTLEMLDTLAATLQRAIDDGARAVLLTLLSHLGVDGHFAVDGREAVAMWEKERWDAILMDVHMPVMDGVQASQAIRAGERRTGRPRTPIIAVTASVLTHERTLYAEAGMDALVAKPVEVPRLVEALAKVLALDTEDGARGVA